MIEVRRFTDLIEWAKQLDVSYRDEFNAKGTESSILVNSSEGNVPLAEWNMDMGKGWVAVQVDV